MNVERVKTTLTMTTAREQQVFLVELGKNKVTTQPVSQLHWFGQFVLLLWELSSGPPLQHVPPRVFVEHLSAQDGELTKRPLNKSKETG